jgi:glycosyltransferase involved in cell wall biosynthesis
VSETPFRLPDGCRLIVIIPAFNEEASLARVVGNVRRAAPGADVLVINDGSDDRTAAVARGAGALVITHPFNLGIGAAMQTGFLFAEENGYDYAVQVDGDGQHDPREIADILRPVLAAEADVVAGSRYIEDRGYITPALRRFGIMLLGTAISAITQRRVTDPTSGFRASNRKAICFCARHYPSDYPEPESVVLFWQARLRMIETPVTMNPRFGGQSSITPFRSFYYMVKVFLAILVGLLRQVPRAGGDS